MRIEIDDPARPDVFALLDEHLRNMHELSPPESVHALDVSRLRRSDITFWTVRDGDQLLGCVKPDFRLSMSSNPRPRQKQGA